MGGGRFEVRDFPAVGHADFAGVARPRGFAAGARVRRLRLDAVDFAMGDSRLSAATKHARHVAATVAFGRPTQWWGMRPRPMTPNDEIDGHDVSLEAAE
jgi:hypothetical protein